MNSDLVGYNNESADLIAVALLGGEEGATTAASDRYIVGGGNFVWNVEKSIFRTLTIYFAYQDLGGQNIPTDATSTSNQSAAPSTTPTTTTTSGSSSVQPVATDVIIQNITIRVRNVTGSVLFSRMPMSLTTAALLISDSSISMKDSKGKMLGFGFGGYDTIENSVIEVEGCTFGRLEISPAASADGSQEAQSSSSSVLFRETALMMRANTFNGGNNTNSQRPPPPACFVVATFSDSSTVEFSNNTLASLKSSPSSSAVVDSGVLLLSALIKSSSQLHFANNVLAAGGMSLMVDFAQCAPASTGTSNPSPPCLLWVEKCSFLGSASVATGMLVGTDSGIDTSGALLVIDGNFASEFESNNGANPTTTAASPSTTPMNLLFARLRGSGFVSLLNNHNVRPLLGFSDGYGGHVEIWGNVFSDLSPSGPAPIEYYTVGTQQSTTSTTTVTAGGGAGSTVIPSVLFGYNVGSFALSFRYQSTVGLALAKTVVGCTEVTIPAPSAADPTTTRIILAPSFSATYECPNLKKSNQRDFSIAQQNTTSATTTTTIPSSSTTVLAEETVPTILRCDGTVVGIEQFLPRYERVNRPSVEACFAAPAEGLVTDAPPSTTETTTDPTTSASASTAAATTSAHPNTTTTTFIFTTNATTTRSTNVSAAPTDSRTNETTTTAATTTATTRQRTTTTTNASTSAAPTTPTPSPAATGADRTHGKKSGEKDKTAAGIIIAAVGAVVVFLIISAIAIYFGYCRPRLKKDDPPYSEIGGGVGEGDAEPSYGVPPHLAGGQPPLNQRVDKGAQQRKMMGREINFGANNNSTFSSSSSPATARGGRQEMHAI